MPEQINNSADLWVAVEADITGADSSKDASSSTNRSAQPSLMVGTYNSSLPTITSGTSGALQLDSSGRLLVGSVASLPLPGGAATSALQTTGNGFLSTLAGAVAGTEMQVDIISAPTITIADGGSSITVDGGVNATQQGSWTVDLGATDNGVLDAIAASLAGTLTVSGTVMADTGLSQPLTDSQLRATAVPIANTSLETLAGAVASGEVKTALRSLGTFTDRSASTSSTPGNWTVLAATNANRTRLFLRVPLSAAAPVTIGRGAVGAEVVYDEIQPGGAFLIQASAGLAIDTAAFNVRSTAASVAFIAHEHGA